MCWLIACSRFSYRVAGASVGPPPCIEPTDTALEWPIGAAPRTNNGHCGAVPTAPGCRVARSRCCVTVQGPSLDAKISWVCSNPMAKETGSYRRHADFIQRVTQRAAERRVAKRPEALIATQHAALREQLKDVHFLKPYCADSTKINMAAMLRK